MGKHIVAILKNSHGIHTGRPRRKRLQCLSETCQSVTYQEIVLFVIISVDISYWLSCACFNSF